jgi:hypothetical protein
MKEIAMRIVHVLFLGLGALAACAESTPPPASVTPAASSAGPAVASKPDRAALITHFKEHVKYPVGRAEILKACADTPEFTAGEKKWIDANLPEGSYKSADEVIAAVKL